MNLDISRVGEPRLVKIGPTVRSVRVQNIYEMEATPLPAGRRGYAWSMLFDKHLRAGRFPARHDGTKIIAECWPEDEALMIKAIDIAIAKANEQEGNVEYEPGTVSE